MREKTRGDTISGNLVNSHLARELLALIVGGDNPIEIAEEQYRSSDNNLGQLGKDSSLEDIEGIGKATVNPMNIS